MGTRQISLSVNEVAIELDYFIQGFIDHVVGGMLAALEGTGGEINTVALAIDEDQVSINLNEAEVPINPFVNGIIRNTIIGIVSSLKGVSEINRININIKR